MVAGADTGAAAFLVVGAGSSTPSANRLSNLDSTPATACWRKEPHFEPCFCGAVIVRNPALLPSRGRVVRSGAWTSQGSRWHSNYYVWACVNVVYAIVDWREVGGLVNWMFSYYDCRLKFIGKRGVAKWVGIRSSGLRVFCSNIFGSSNRVVQISPPLSSNTPTNPSLICCKAGL